MWGALTRDLQEFVSVVQSDTREVLATAVSKGDAQDTLPKSVDAARGEETAQRNNESPAAVRLLRADLKTYTEPIPAVEQQNFEDFLEDFDIKSEELADKVNGLLSSDGTMSKLHRELVPEVVSYENFWTRYFFRLSKIEKQHSSSQIPLAFDLDEDPVELGWDNENVEDEQTDDSRAKEAADDENPDVKGSGQESHSAQMSPPVSETISKTSSSGDAEANAQKITELNNKIQQLEKELSAKDQEISILKQDKTSLERRIVELESKSSKDNGEDEDLEGWEEWG